jgi:hypothetical protein
MTQQPNRTDIYRVLAWALLIMANLAIVRCVGDVVAAKNCWCGEPGRGAAK